MRRLYKAIPVACVAFVAGFVEACSSERVTVASAAAVAVCHRSGTTGSIVEVSLNELPTHRSHGDYFVNLSVGKSAAGSPDSTRFTRIEAALASVRAGRLARGEGQSAACRITIAVDSGTFRGTAAARTDTTIEHFPLVVDVPDVTLRGMLMLGSDATGRVTTAQPGNPTALSPLEPLPIVGGATSQTGSSTPIILANGHPDGSSAGHGLIVQGFLFQSGHIGIDTLVGGQGVFALRVQRLTITGNRFESGFTEMIDLRASDGVVDRNLFGGVLTAAIGACDICITGPGQFIVSNNKLLVGGIPGILSVPGSLLPVPSIVEQYTLPAAATIVATVTNNAVSDHLRKPVGVGVRVGTVGVGAPNVVGTSKVMIRGNALVNNTFGVIVEAAFPVANTALRGDATVTLDGNVFQQSCQNDLLVSFSRHTTAIGAATQPQPYLKGSTYTLSLGGNLKWSDAWFSNPDGFGNTLIVDGQTIANGTRHSYDAARTCPPS